METHHLGDTLQVDGADLDELDTRRAGRVDDILADHDFTRPGVIGDSGSDVHRPAEVVALLEQHRSGMKTHVGRRQPQIRRGLDHLQGGQNPFARLGEMEHDAISEPFDRGAAMTSRVALHHRCQALCELGGDFVAPFLGQTGETGQVEEADRRQPLRWLVEPGVGQGDFESLEDVPDPGFRLLTVIDGEQGHIDDLGEGG